MSVNVLLVEDDNAMREALQGILEAVPMNVVAAGNGNEALEALDSGPVDIIVSDINMPAMDGLSLLKKVTELGLNIPMIMMTAYGRIDQAVECIQSGAKDYLSKPFSPDRLVDLIQRYVVPTASFGDSFIAEDPASREVFKLAEKVAQSDSSVMILGESGTGKEVLARFIHDHSPRSSQPFVAVNCAAIPENMLEAILFGHEKGAFTGAHRAMPGKFEQADGGTLLLDEITEMDISLQSKLLRVLQERQVERLGSKQTLDLDVRVLATSNRELSQAVEEGVFREDLYYRLAVFPIRWKPLRERIMDIVPLANYFLDEHASRMNTCAPKLSLDAEKKLMAYRWPGNVRELDNVIQRALILSDANQISADDIFLDDESLHPSSESLESRHVSASQGGEDSSGVQDSGDLSDQVQSTEYRAILDTLKRNGGSKKKTAETLGISARTLRYKLAKMRERGIDVDGAAMI